MLIGIHGKARTGKDTIAKRIVRSDSRFIRFAFADKLKQSCQVMFDLTDEQTWDDNVKDVIIKRLGRSPRQLFQTVGEGMRQLFGQDVWLDHLKWLYEEAPSMLLIVISDVRHQNEVDYIRKHGIMWHVLSDRSPLSGDVAKHISEVPVLPEPGEIIIENFKETKMTFLFEQVDMALKLSMSRAA